MSGPNRRRCEGGSPAPGDKEPNVPPGDRARGGCDLGGELRGQEPESGRWLGRLPGRPDAAGAGLYGPTVRPAAAELVRRQRDENFAEPLAPVAPPAPRTEARRAAQAGVLDEVDPVCPEGTELALMVVAATGLLESASGLVGQHRHDFYGLRARLVTWSQRRLKLRG